MKRVYYDCLLYTSGEYKVVAIVAEDTNYKSASAEKTFHISQANNAWKDKLSITGWTYGEPTNAPNASAQFGTATYSYCCLLYTARCV